jgi:hypothetical protein
MANNCIFCGNPAGSREHIWPKWVLARRDFGPFRLKRAGQKEVILNGAELTVKTVCGHCNNGWMGKLEATLMPILIPMFERNSVTLDKEQQRLVSLWLVKMAFLYDSAKGRDADNTFYEKSEGAAFATTEHIPNFTGVWIGQLEEEHRALDGADFTLNNLETRIGNGSVVTLANEHLVAQVVTLRLKETPEGPTQLNLNAKYPHLNEMLIRIHPQEKDEVQWPPKDSFTNGGPRGYAYLMDRWRIGEEQEKIVTRE